MTARNPDESVQFDDLSRYVATFSDTERMELTAAGAAVDLAVLLHDARVQRGLTQAAAAQRSGFAQQAISRFERPGANVQIATLQRYLNALGYDLEVAIRDQGSGEHAGHVAFPRSQQLAKVS